MSRLVHPASDELTKPLGVDRQEPSRRRPGSIARPLAASLGVVLAAAIVYATWFGAPLGGIPATSVPITAASGNLGAPGNTMASGKTGPASLPDPETPVAEPARRDAAAIEGASGVAVTRPPGTSAPASVIVSVQGTSPNGLAPAPNDRLAERTRFGILPKIGPDGARAAEVYARPAGRLPGGAKPAGMVAILVGGLGISQSGTADAVARLPADVTLAFAPYATGLEAAAAGARAAGHEVMLQVPMEPFDYPDSDPGPHTLTVAARAGEMLDQLRWALGRFTGYTGIVNYMGGKLTADPGAIASVLREVDSRGLTMLDDGSSSRSRAREVAGHATVARADLVVDAVARPDTIDKALQDLEALARARGMAVGSATAFPATVDRVTRWAAGLASRGILLVPVSAAMKVPPAERAGP